MLVLAAIARLEYDDLDVVCDGYSIDTDEVQEPDAAMFALSEKARKATERELIGMLKELALLPSGTPSGRCACDACVFPLVSVAPFPN